MFTPNIIEETNEYTKIQINPAIVLTINFVELDKDGEISIDYDETLITAQEAKELTNSFIYELISIMKNKNTQGI